MDFINSAVFWTAVGSLAALASFVFTFITYFAPKNQLKRSLKRNLNLQGIDGIVNKLVEKKVRSKFKDYGSYILIRYGSSVKLSGNTPNDFDYLVLLLGYTDDNQRVELQNGDAFGSPKIGKYIDIEYMDYNSFIFALLSGMPFEHGVINNCYFINGNRGYLSWLIKLQNNINIDTKYIINTLIERCKDYNKSLEDDLANGSCDYSSIIKLYSLSSSLIQIDCLKTFPQMINYKYIIPITKGEYLLKILSDSVMKNAYQKILSYFKRELIELEELDNEIRQLKNVFLSSIGSVLNEQ